MANNERMLSVTLMAWMLIGWQEGAVGALSRETQEYSIAGDLQGHQQQPCVAIGRKGGFLVWHHESGQQGSSGRLVIQSLSQGMMGVGLPSPLSRSSGETREANSCIVLLADGGAVVAWETGPRNSRDIRVRFLSSSGLFTTAEITANENIAGDQFQPAVTVLTDGRVMVAWTSAGQDGGGNGIYAQRFTATGVKWGAEFRVNESIKWNQGEVALASLTNGRMVSIWVSESVIGRTSQGAPNLRGNLMGRLFHANSQPVAGEFRINALDAVCSRPTVKSLGEGFVIAWEQLDEKVMSNLTDIFVRRFDKNGLSPTQEIRWNALRAGAQTNPVLAVFEEDGLLVWECDVQATNSIEVHARMLMGGAEFRVNQKVKYHQQQPVVAGSRDGNYLVAWVNFISARRSNLTAMQFGASDKADVTAGAHVKYDGPGAAPLILTAKIPESEDFVAAEIQRRNLRQQLSSESNADEQSRQAALVAQTAAAAKASGLLQQMAETQEPAAPSASGMAMQDSNVRRSPIASDLMNSQGNSGEASSGTSIARTNVLINRRTAGATILSSQAQASLSGIRPLTARATIRRRPVSSNGSLAVSSKNSRRQVTATLPQGMQRLGGYATQQSARGMTSGVRGNNRRSVSQGSPLRQAQGSTTARRLRAAGLATLRSQTTGGSRSMATAASRLNGMRSQRMPSQTHAQQSRTSSHVNASLVRGGGGYQLQWASRSGARYQVQRSRDSSNWVNDGPVQRGTGRSINSPISISGQHRYFRVIKSQ